MGTGRRNKTRGSEIKAFDTCAQKASWASEYLNQFLFPQNLQGDMDGPRWVPAHAVYCIKEEEPEVN